MNAGEYATIMRDGRGGVGPAAAAVVLAPVPGPAAGAVVAPVAAAPQAVVHRLLLWWRHCGQVLAGSLGRDWLGGSRDGTWIHLRCLSPVIPASAVYRVHWRPSTANPLCDGRILPVNMNSLVQPERPLAEAVAGCKELDMGWNDGRWWAPERLCGD